MKKTFVLLFVLFVVSFSCFSSGEKESATSERKGVTVVSLSPGITETMFALGCGECVIGRTDYCTSPTDCLSIQSVGTLYNPDLELIVSLRPDYVLASSIVDDSVIKMLERFGIKAIQYECEESLEGTYNLIKNIGSITGFNDRAQNLVSELKSQIESVSSVVMNEKKTSCVYLVGWDNSSVYAATGKTYIDDMIRAAGGENAAGSCRHWVISRELLLKENPDVIILPKYSYTDEIKEEAKFRSDSFFGKLSGRIVFVDATLMEHQGPEAANTVWILAGILHPALF